MSAFTSFRAPRGFGFTDASSSTWTFERASRSPSREVIVTVNARRRRAREGPGVSRASPRDEVLSDAAAAEERSATLALVDELAMLAADLWFAGRLDRFPVQEEAPDGDDD